MAEDSHVFSARLFGSLHFSYVPASATELPVGGLDEQADVDAMGVWRHSFVTRRVRDDKHQVGLNASTFFDTGVLRHEVKLGLGYWHVRLDMIREWPGDQMVGFAPPPPLSPDDPLEPGEVAITRRQNSKSLVNLYDVFAGDTIQAGKLTVNVGARFDYQQGKNLPSSVPASPAFPDLLPAIQYPGDSGFPSPGARSQPRVSATYALNEGRTLLRASYSRFTDQMDSTTVFAISRFPDVTGLRYEWKDANGDGRVQSSEVDTSDEGFLYPDGVDPEEPGLRRAGQPTLEGPEAAHDGRVHRRRRAAVHAQPRGLSRVHPPDPPPPHLQPDRRDDAGELAILRQRDRDCQRRRVRDQLRRALLRTHRLPGPVRRATCSRTGPTPARPTTAWSSS